MINVRCLIWMLDACKQQQRGYVLGVRTGRQRVRLKKGGQELTGPSGVASRGSPQTLTIRLAASVIALAGRAGRAGRRGKRAWLGSKPSPAFFPRPSAHLAAISQQ